MRRQSLVASAVLTAALALGALPGVAGSSSPSPARPLQAAALQAVRLPASSDGSPLTIRPLDAAGESAGRIDNTESLIEPGTITPVTERVAVNQPTPEAVTVLPPKPRIVEKPKVTAARATTTSRPAAVPKPRLEVPPFKRMVAGLASWYDNGTTAMRLPRGTQVRICGARGCVSRVVKDWGPARYLSNRIVDMTPSDFMRVTGKSLGAGLASVKVYIY